MARIGIFMDALKGSIPLPFRERIALMIGGLPDIGFCLQDEDLASPGGLERMAKRLEKGDVERVVVIGGNPKFYESSFLKLGISAAMNPYLFSVANIRDQALLMETDAEGALEKAKEIMMKAVRMASLLKPIETDSLPLKPEVLVLGGGIVGISISLELARSGIRVVLVEKGERLGGRALELRTFYNRPVEVHKWIDEKISEVNKTSNITVLTQAELKALEGHLGRFQARVKMTDGGVTAFSPSVIVVATGYETRHEATGIYGHKRIVAFPEMERLLAVAGAEDFQPLQPLQWEGKPVQTVTYLLDEVNQDIKVDSINTIKQSLALQETFQCQVAVLCKDVKVSTDGMERLYRRAREKGVLFFKYEEAPKLSIVNGQIRIDVKDTAAIRKEEQWPVSILSDLVVVSEAFVSAPEAEHLSRILRLHLGNRGFLMEDNPQLLRVRSNRRGIFVAGGCRFPQEVSESLIEARAVAQEVVALLAKGAYPYDLAVAEVDPKKCAVCYTCPRLCPHSAITVEKYAERNIYAPPGATGGITWWAAKVDPVACYGCGICVAECPAKAITFRHLTDEQIYAQMNLTDGWGEAEKRRRDEKEETKIPNAK